MIFAAHQPNFVPYTRFWAKVDSADVFGMMPSAQYTKGDYHNRVMVGRDEDANWCTVPVSVSLGDRIDQVRIAGNFRVGKLTGLIQQKYRRSRFWKEYGEQLIDSLEQSRPEDLLIDLNMRLIGMMIEMLDIDTKIVTVDQSNEDPSAALAGWAVANECSTYLSGKGGSVYLDRAPFEDAGVSVEYIGKSLMNGYRTVSVITSLMDNGRDWRRVIDDE